MNNEQIKEELLKAKEAFIKSTKSEENDLRKEKARLHLLIFLALIQKYSQFP